MGKVNGKSVTTGILGGDKKGMILTADLGECAYAISMVELEITAPVEGKLPLPPSPTTALPTAYTAVTCAGAFPPTVLTLQ